MAKEEKKSIFSLFPNYVSPLGDWEVQEKKEEKSVKSQLSIKYLSCSDDDKNFNLSFEVTSTNLITGISKIYVDEIDSISKDTAVPPTAKTINKTGTTAITLSFSKDKDFTEILFDDGNSFKATITCDGLSAETKEFKLKCAKTNEGACTLIEPKAVISKKLTLTKEEQAKFVATIYAETWSAKNQFEPFSWIYFNLVSRQGFEKGMNNSSAYKDKTYQYKIGLEFYDTDKNEDVNKIKEIIENKILADKPVNPYSGWENQGYYGDMNIRAPKTGSRRVWAYASQYFHLQNQCKVKAVLVKEFRATKKTSKGLIDITGYIYNFNEIEKYFNNHPKDLPEYEIGECENDKLSITQKNAIPAVHKIDPCKPNK